MPFPKEDTTGSASSEKMVYPIDLLRQVAAKILVDADMALQQHQTLWKGVQGFLYEHDVNGKMAAVLEPHEKRMRDSYNWQMQLASTLFAAIDAVTTTDQDAANLFKNHHGYER
jgi:hypothetical protein